MSSSQNTSSHLDRILDNVIGKCVLQAEFLAVFFFKNRVLKYLRIVIAHNRLRKLMTSLNSPDLPNERIVQLFFGKLRLEIANVHDLLMFSVLQGDGFYEEPVTKLMESLIHSGDVCVDVGSNNGYYTLLFSYLVGKNGKVITFEPSDSAYERLLRNIELNKLSNTVPYKCALSNIAERRALFKSTLENGQNSLARVEATSLSGTLVNTIYLDGFRNIHRVDFVKIDAEGWELPIIKGMNKILESNNDIKIVVEYNLRTQIAAGFGPNDLITAFKEKGFLVFEIMEDKFKLKMIKSWRELTNPLTNILVCRSISSFLAEGGGYYRIHVS